MSKTEKSAGLPRAMVDRVTSAFLIHDVDDLALELPGLEGVMAACLSDAAQGLRGVVRAGTLPFHLILDAVNQRRFDRFAIAERILALKGVAPGGQPTKEALSNALKNAHQRMTEFIHSEEGTTFVRDAVVRELDRSLDSEDVSIAATELLIQTLVSTWAVFEHFSSSFIIKWIDQDAKRSRSVLSAADLKSYFGKQVVDLDAIDDYGFDLTRLMGTVIFREKRLDNLAVIRSVLNVLFNDRDVRDSLGDDLWMLNQRRHLFVHKRGLVDQEYLRRTGDNVLLGQRLSISSTDVERYITAVKKAIVAICNAAKRQNVMP